jgi:hypothetical protein
VQVIGAREDVDAAIRLLQAAKLAHVPLNAAHLVLQSIRQEELAQMARPEVLPGESVGVSAEALCDAVIEVVQEWAKGERRAKKLLKDMELCSSEDIGRVMHALIEAELVVYVSPDAARVRFSQLRSIEEWLRE